LKGSANCKPPSPDASERNPTTAQAQPAADDPAADTGGIPPVTAFAAGPIVGEIGAAPDEFSLATVAYECAAITTIAMHRWLVERLGWRNFVLISLAVFAVGCVVCAAGDSYVRFLIGRVIMALGGAAFLTSGRVIVNLIPPSPMRFVGMNYFATGLTLGIVLAPGLAALAVAHDGWREIFVILIAIGLVAALVAAVSLPSELLTGEARGESNPLFMVSLLGGSFLVLYALQRTQYDFFGNATMLGVGLACGALARYSFLRGIHRHGRPLLSSRDSIIQASSTALPCSRSATCCWGQASPWQHVVPALACNGIFVTLVMATTAIQTFRDV